MRFAPAGRGQAVVRPGAAKSAAPRRKPAERGSLARTLGRERSSLPPPSRVAIGGEERRAHTAYRLRKTLGYRRLIQKRVAGPKFAMSDRC